MNKKRKKLEGQELKKTILFVLVFATSFLYIAWRLLFTLPLRHGLVAVVFGVILWIAESLNTVETFTHFNNARHVRIPEMPVIPESMYPDVDVLICTHNESAELLYKTLNGCNYMRYPDFGKVHIYICDDANRLEIKQLTQKMGVRYFGFDGNKHAKAGNINYALERTVSPLVAIFDADMIPTKDFLMETVPYFFSNEVIQKDGVWRLRTSQEKQNKEKPLGYVQTRQSFYNPDPLQRNLYMEQLVTNEQDYFYRAVNVARTHSDSAAFAGSNTVFSRKALEEVGGLATYSITEDLATSIPVISAGYRTVAVDKELAHGLSPDDAFNFIKQRKRWSRGSSQVIPTGRFFSSALPVKSKWNFFTSYLYWWTFMRRFIFILAPILYGVFGVIVADVTLVELLAVWLPYYLIYNTGLRIMSGDTINALWNSIVDTVQFPYLLWPVIAGTLKIPEKKFWVTPKEKVMGRNSSLRLAIPHITLAVLSLITVLVCGYQVVTYRYEGAIIVLYWAAYNFLILLIAIAYYRGRMIDSEYERIPVKVPAALIVDNQLVNVKTVFLAEDCLMVVPTQETELPLGEEIWVAIQDNDYKAQMKVIIKQIEKMDGEWQYLLHICEIDDAQKREYLQIIYDRNHPFSQRSNITFLIVLKSIVTGWRQDSRTRKSKKRKEYKTEKVH